MSASLPGNRPLPQSRYDLSTYWGRVRQSMEITDPSTLFVTSSGLQDAKNLVSRYKLGDIKSMTPELWQAKKIVDSTLHPDTGEPVFLPFRMSCFVLSNLVVTAGMLTPNLKTRGTLAWQITNQSLNVAINFSNANKSTPISHRELATNYLLAVSASCSVALGLNALVPRLKSLSPAAKTILARLVPFAAVASAGALNVFLMRSSELRNGIDVFPSSSEHLPRDSRKREMALETEEQQPPPESLGRSQKAALYAVSETALSRVLNSTPIMVLPPLILVRLQRSKWLSARPKMVLPVNLGLILTTSIFALPLALGAFPQRQSVAVERVEERFQKKVGKGGRVEFNRGI